MGQVELSVQGLEALAYLQEEKLEQLRVSRGLVGSDVVEEISILALLEHHHRLIVKCLVPLTPLCKLVVVVLRDAPGDLNRSFAR